MSNDQSHGRISEVITERSTVGRAMEGVDGILRQQSSQQTTKAASSGSGEGKSLQGLLKQQATPRPPQPRK